MTFNKDFWFLKRNYGNYLLWLHGGSSLHPKRHPYGLQRYQSNHQCRLVGALVFHLKEKASTKLGFEPNWYIFKFLVKNLKKNP